MNRISWIAVAGLVFAVAASARAGGLFPPAPIPERVGLADVVVIGQVTGFGEKLVSAPRYPGAADAQFQAAVVRIDDAIIGGKGLKEINVGFLAPAGTDDPPNPAQRGLGQLTLDEQGLFFLVGRPDAPFYELQDVYGVIEKTETHAVGLETQRQLVFGKACDEAKRCAKLLADPRAGLKARTAEDRFLTAALLVTRYLAPRMNAPQAGTEAVDAEESKLILQTLADADWDAGVPSAVSASKVDPARVFLQLDIQAADGWKRPDDFDEYPAAAKKWLKEHAETYRLRRYVYDKGGEKKDEKKDR